ncbi:MAG: nucleotidyltransferase domain-containing protein [Nanoarchaeota archaeon]
MGHSKLKELFFEHPSDEFYLRQIAKLTRIPKTTVSRLLQELLKEHLVVRKKTKPFNHYQANTENPFYIFYKKHHLLEKLHHSGLIDYLVEKTTPKALVLFGSCAKGEYTEKSDIDLFIQSSPTPLNLKRFKLQHEISLFFEPDLSKLSTELRNNILNGILIYGAIRI